MPTIILACEISGDMFNDISTYFQTGLNNNVMSLSVSIDTDTSQKALSDLLAKIIVNEHREKKNQESLAEIIENQKKNKS